MAKKVVYNLAPDPVTSIKIYEYDRSGKPILVREEDPQTGKVYKITGGPNDKCIINGNSWKESEIKN